MHLHRPHLMKLLGELICMSSRHFHTCRIFIFKGVGVDLMLVESAASEMHPLGSSKASFQTHMHGPTSLLLPPPSDLGRTSFRALRAILSLQASRTLVSLLSCPEWGICKVGTGMETN